VRDHGRIGSLPCGVPVRPLERKTPTRRISNDLNASSLRRPWDNTVGWKWHSLFSSSKGITLVKRRRIHPPVLEAPPSCRTAVSPTL